MALSVWMRRLAVVVALVAGAGPLSAAELSVDDIVTKAYQVDGGRDGVSRLSFTFNKPNLPEKKLVYTMVWKLYGGKDGVDIKLLFFSEFPPDDRGKGFMAYIYDDGRMNDHWMYLPELRMVRKMSHADHQHAHEDDDFAHSVLTGADLIPRRPGADHHELVGEEVVDGKAYYVITSVPKQPTADYLYSRTVRWISKDNFLTELIEYYRGDKLEKNERIKWKQIDDHWVWERVVGELPKDGSRTVLDISDIRINLGLGDGVFSARSLRNGVEAVLR